MKKSPASPQTKKAAPKKTTATAARKSFSKPQAKRAGKSPNVASAKKG